MSDWKETKRKEEKNETIRSSFALSFVNAWFLFIHLNEFLNDESNTSCVYKTLTGTTGNWTTEKCSNGCDSRDELSLRLLLEVACAAAAYAYVCMCHC